MSGYDRALTVFSPDGHLFQVEYACEAVKKGTTTLGIRAKNCIILAVENKAMSTLQADHAVKKISQIDEHIYLTFAGLLADARVLVDTARLECQNHRLTYDEAPSVASVTDYIARTQQKHTQRGGMRPFGVSTILAACDPDKSLRLFLTEPGGVTTEWYACVIGRGEAVVRKYLENHYHADMDEESAIDLAIRALLEVLEPNKKFFDIFVLPKDVGRAHFLSEEILEERIRVADAARTAKEKEAKLSGNNTV
ncbi:proteasome subunit alpha type-7 [Perkinsela sp. CCAP 1560/4]|nr:proteasome subunit alpha type-7 [Perkinsela sp. CCAP 1560/4]|eukprot:KNH07286.1 proteasome subunit alpha type-7 [Perkinsela sp. CCAP 1560/4]